MSNWEKLSPDDLMALNPPVSGKYNGILIKPELINGTSGKPDMTETEKRIEVVKLLHELRRDGEATGDVFLRGLNALKSLPEVERVRDEWCAEYVRIRDLSIPTIAQYIASHFLGTDCDLAALKHAEAILAGTYSVSRSNGETP